MWWGVRPQGTPRILPEHSHYAERTAAEQAADILATNENKPYEVCTYTDTNDDGLWGWQAFSVVPPGKPWCHR